MCVCRLKVVCYDWRKTGVAESFYSSLNLVAHKVGFFDVKVTQCVNLISRSPSMWYSQTSVIENLSDQTINWNLRGLI